MTRCFENNCLNTFPTTSQKFSRACKPSVSFICHYCDCRLPESFDSVVACDGCDNWKCVDFNTNHVGNWFCNHCRTVSSFCFYNTLIFLTCCLSLCSKSVNTLTLHALHISLHERICTMQGLRNFVHKKIGIAHQSMNFYFAQLPSLCRTYIMRDNLEMCRQNKHRIA